ncbi:hypothetical protein PAPYR_4800 [Paratrimastix pyriformis]|uniref:DUF1648 domain-containing protein n=1 Tax=Paratrimastix pyriformis TaxID=342808 RepID=A0ABQ8UJ57_9EUKA|nr:hypothetical protein PAPYR_4800 [Paratrimastix pyriformis]
MKRCVLINFLITLFVIALIVIEGIVWLCILPDTVVTHWDAAGNPNGWGSKWGFVLICSLVPLGLMLFMSLIGICLPKVPDDLINLPNKEYYLAPQNRSSTFNYIRISFLQFSNALAIYMLVVEFSCGMANYYSWWPQAAFIWAPMGIFLAWMVFWVICLYRRFRRPTAHLLPGSGTRPDDTDNLLKDY